MGSHQVVSKHSIQRNARRKVSDGTHNHRIEAFRERVRQIGAPKEPDHGRHYTNATAQSDFKVYDPGRGKIENPNSRRGGSREEEIELHWNRRRQGDTGCRTRRHHAPTRRSGWRDKILEKIDEILITLRSPVPEIVSKSRKPEVVKAEASEDPEPEVVKPKAETE